MNRRVLREVVLKALYAVESGGNSPEEALKGIVVAELEQMEPIQFAEQLFLRTVDGSGEYDRIVSEHIRNWKLDRLAILDKLILRMALCEFLRFGEIPVKVTMNEAIELAKRYSTRRSGYFINGILDAALKRLLEEGRIEKHGRGLQDFSEEKSI
ncbi:MAG: transcription antitermination factor NusB [Balneolaceae bacterium]